MYSRLRGYTGSSVAINPKNGEILGMISAPAVDPNQKLWKLDVDQEQAQNLKAQCLIALPMACILQDPQSNHNGVKWSARKYYQCIARILCWAIFSTSK